MQGPTLQQPETYTPEPMGVKHGQEELDLLDILIILARRKRLIFTVTIGAAVVAALATFLMPIRYAAETTLMPPQQSQSSTSMLLNQLTSGGGVNALAMLAGKDFGMNASSDLFISILKSRTVEDGIIQKFDLQTVYGKKKISDTRRALEDASDITAGKEGMIKISVEDEDANRAAGIANQYVLELRTLTKRIAFSEASQRRMFFEDQVKDAKDALAEAEVAFRDSQQKTGMIQLDSQAKAIIEAVAMVRAQIAAKEVQLHAMRSFATDQNPQIILSEQELKGLRDQLDKLEKQQPTAAGDPIFATSKVPGLALEYIRRLREVKYREAVFEVMAKQFEAAKLDEAKEATIIQVVDAAAPPDRKSWPKRTLLVSLAFVLTLIGSITFVLTSEAMARVKQDDDFNARFDALRSYLKRKQGHLEIEQKS